MSSLKVYGTPFSRAHRTMWMAKELGIDFDLVSVDQTKGDTRVADYLKINPNGLIPTIKDGDFILWESLAINLYLCKKYGGAAAPADLEEEALATQWSMWALNYIEPGGAALIQNFLKPEADRDPATHNRVRELWNTPLDVFEAHLTRNKFVLGDRFTVADLNVASCMGPAMRTGYDLSDHPKVEAWLKGCLSRPASTAARETVAAA